MILSAQQFDRLVEERDRHAADEGMDTFIGINIEETSVKGVIHVYFPGTQANLLINEKGYSLEAAN